MSNQLLHLGKFGLDSHLLEREILARGLCTLRFSPTAFLAGRDREHASEIGFHYTASNLTSKVGREIAGDHQRTRSMLLEAGVPVPAGRAFGVGRIRLARRYAADLGYPVVVKPARGRLGTGVALELSNDDQVASAIDALGVDDAEGRFVVEEHILGSTYRVLVIGNRAVSVLRRLPAAVVGDGSRTVEQLVADKNAEREQHPYFRTRKIELDEEVLSTLAAYDLRPDSVVESGRRVSLRSQARASLDGEYEDVSSEAHENLRSVAERAVSAIPGIHHAGVDVVATDHRDVPPGKPPSVVDVDVVPNLAPHELSPNGEGQRVISAIVDLHAPDTPVRDIRRLDVVLSGSTRPSSLSRKIEKLAGELNVSADVTVDDRDGTVAAGLDGPLELISIIPALAAVGSRAPELIETVPGEVSA